MIAGFSQGGLGLPERDYYFREGKNAEEIRAAYVAHIARTLELAGDAPASAKAAADSIMAFETKLAKASRTLVDLRDPEKNYNKFPRAALGKLAPGLDWNGYFAAIAFPGNETQRCWFASRSFSRPSTACSPPSRWRSGAITCVGTSSPKPPTISASLLWRSVSPSTERNSPGRRNCGRAGSACSPRRTPPSARIWANSTCRRRSAPPPRPAPRPC